MDVVFLIIIGMVVIAAAIMLFLNRRTERRSTRYNEHNTPEAMIEAREWLRRNSRNYLHIVDPCKTDEALEIIGKFYDAGAVKVEVTAEPDDSDEGEEERGTLYMTLPESIPEKLLECILDFCPRWVVVHNHIFDRKCFKSSRTQ